MESTSTTSLFDQRREREMGCYNSCVIPAPAAAVWAVLRDFHDMSWASQSVKSLERIGDGGDRIGARRVVNGRMHETLLALNDVDRVFKYRIDDGPEALSKDKVTGYVAKVVVSPVTDTNTAFVEWSSNWQESEADVKAFCDPIYTRLLAQLKAHFE
jgi:hypothetical protein